MKTQTIHSIMNITNTHTEMNANTHDQILTTTPGVAQATNPLYDRILLGIDQHAADLRIVRQLDGAGTQPPQRVYPTPKLKLLEQVSEAMRFKHYSLRAERAARQWIERFLSFRRKRRRGDGSWELGNPDGAHGVTHPTSPRNRPGRRLKSPSRAG